MWICGGADWDGTEEETTRALRTPLGLQKVGQEFDKSWTRVEHQLETALHAEGGQI